MAAQSSPSLVLISPLSLVTRARQRVSTFRRDMRQRSSDCMSNRCLAFMIRNLTICSLSRTDRAVLAVNGFAADGNMFVKKVKQRLEVCVPVWSRLACVYACTRVPVTRRVCLSLYLSFYLFNTLLSQPGQHLPNTFPPISMLLCSLFLQFNSLINVSIIIFISI